MVSLMPTLSPNPRALCIPKLHTFLPKRQSSSKRWQNRQFRDRFTREAAVQGLKSRAAFKLLQIDEKYKIFRSGQSVVDLGYAPGSWSQVAADRTKPNGRVIGVDIIPAQPPKGVSTIQGNFLAPDVQEYILDFLQDPKRGRPYQDGYSDVPSEDGATDFNMDGLSQQPVGSALDMQTENPHNSVHKNKTGLNTIDVVLSDMSAPWHQTSGFWKRSLSEPYNRMMNTSGMSFRDHAGSMDLCHAALQFSVDALKIGGHFVCKFYQGTEDKDLGKQLSELFRKVHKLKPESSRNESKEAYFIGLERKGLMK